MSAVGAYMAFMKSQMGNVFDGAMTFYQVSTACRRRGRTGIFDWLGLLFVLAAGNWRDGLGVEEMNSPTGSKDGNPAIAYFGFRVVALLSAAGDVRMLVRGGVFGARRIARHLWRMCFALFIAAASIFLARPQPFPAILSIPPLLFMIFWLFRVRFTNADKRKP